MDKAIHSRLGECFRQAIVEIRQQAGLNQRQLARKLAKPRSFVGRLEVGERRLDVVEFYWLCKACGIDPQKAAQRVMRLLEAAEVGPKKKKAG